MSVTRYKSLCNLVISGTQALIELPSNPEPEQPLVNGLSTRPRTILVLGGGGMRGKQKIDLDRERGSS